MGAIGICGTMMPGSAGADVEEDTGVLLTCTGVISDERFGADMFPSEFGCRCLGSKLHTRFLVRWRIATS